jgi:hypothetical protein
VDTGEDKIGLMRNRNDQRPDQLQEESMETSKLEDDDDDNMIKWAVESAAI